jgi:hypothetical protein
MKTKTNQSRNTALAYAGLLALLLVALIGTVKTDKPAAAMQALPTPTPTSDSIIWSSGPDSMASIYIFTYSRPQPSALEPQISIGGDRYEPSFRQRLERPDVDVLNEQQFAVTRVDIPRAMFERYPDGAPVSISSSGWRASLSLLNKETKVVYQIVRSVFIGHQDLYQRIALEITEANQRAVLQQIADILQEMIAPELWLNEWTLNPAEAPRFWQAVAELYAFDRADVLASNFSVSELQSINRDGTIIPAFAEEFYVLLNMPRIIIADQANYTAPAGHDQYEWIGSPIRLREVFEENRQGYASLLATDWALRRLIIDSFTPTPSPAVTATFTFTPSPTATDTPTNTPTATATATFTPSATPTVTPTPTIVAPSIFTKLQLTSVCSANPALTRRWQVRNNNAFPLPFNWRMFGSTQTGSGIAVANGDTFFESNTVNGTNTLRLFVGGRIQEVKASGGARCP